MLKVVLPSPDDQTQIRLGFGLLEAHLEAFRFGRPIIADLRSLRVLSPHKHDKMIISPSHGNHFSSTQDDVSFYVNLDPETLRELSEQKTIVRTVPLGYRDVEMSFVYRPTEAQAKSALLELSGTDIIRIDGLTTATDLTVRTPVLTAYSKQNNWIIASKRGEDIVDYLMENFIQEEKWQIEHYMTQIPDVGSVNFSVIPYSILHSMDLTFTLMEHQGIKTVFPSWLEEELLQLRIVPIGIGEEMGGIVDWIFQGVWEDAYQDIPTFLTRHLPTVKDLEDLRLWRFMDLMLYRRYTPEQAAAILLHRQLNALSVK